MNTISQSENTHWSFLKKISFRFFFSYFSLFILLQNNGAYPYFGFIGNFFKNLFYNFVPGIGKTFFGIEVKIPTGPSGSGDTTYDYVLVFSIALIAIFSTLIWSLIDKKSKNYLKMYYWLSLSLRLYVGLMLINYGLVKVIQLQFSPPSFSRLTQTFGEASPMGLAWTFLGFSKGYNLFMGLAEVAAVLLLFRRTLTFGLIITLMTTANVMAVNYFYDVPVKLLSTHLFLMAAFLFARDFNKAWLFFFFRKPVSLTSIYQPPFKKGFKIFLIAAKILLLSYVLGYGTINAMASKERSIQAKAALPLRGLYEIEEVRIQKGKEISDSPTEINGWKNLLIDHKEYALIQYKNGEKLWFTVKIDSLAKSLQLKSTSADLKEYTFTYHEGVDGDFYLNGLYNKDTISIKTKRTLDYREKFLLTNRGFHWINEVPFNR